MTDIFKDQEEDESFVLKLKSKINDINKFLAELNKYFSERYGSEIDDLSITFNDVLSEWEVSSSDSTLRTEYYETIPELISILRKG